MPNRPRQITCTNMNEPASDQSIVPLSPDKPSQHLAFRIYSSQSQMIKASQSNSLEVSHSKRYRTSSHQVNIKSSSIGNSISSHLSLCSVRIEPKHRALGVKWLSHFSPKAMRLLCVVALSLTVLPTEPVNCLARPHHFQSSETIWKSNQDGLTNTNYVDDKPDNQWSQESSKSTGGSADSSGDICTSDSCIETTGLWTKVMDAKNVNPCDNFYQYACGNYQSMFPIPKYLKSWNNFERVYYDIRSHLIKTLTNKELFDKATDKQTVFDKLLHFFQGCMNQKQRDITGYGSLFKLIDDLGGWPMLDEQWNANSFHFEKAYLRLTKLNLFFFVRIEAMNNLFNSTKPVIMISPPYKAKENIVNLGLFKSFRQVRQHFYSFDGRRANVVPDKTEENKPKPQATDRMIAKYKEVIKELKTSLLKEQIIHFNMTAFDLHLDSNLENISILQNSLENSATPMSPISTYQSNYSYFHNFSTIQQFELGFDIKYLVQEMFDITATDNQQFFVPDMDYLKDLSKLLHSAKNKITISNYLITNMVMNLAGHTTSKMINLLITKLDPNPTEQFQNICYEETSQYLPELLGKLYIDMQNITKEWQEDVNLVVKLLNESFHQLLNSSKWMDESTKNEAVSKLKDMSMNIGFPEWYTNESKFEEYCNMFKNIQINDYFSSVVNVNEASHLISKRLSSSGTSSLTSWPGHRQIIDVNAFYYFASNGVYIPVAIAQYPFYSANLPKAVTFGSLGMIIGHEMTHAFDNTGRLYDNRGALRDWWTKETLEAFRNKTECFVKQYSEYSIDSIYIDGKQTLAENIADNGGLREAYRAFKLYQSQNGIDGHKIMPASLKIYNPDQLFFISYAHMWCNQMDPDDVASDIQKNVHSPPSIRVHATLANFDQFANAFECPLGSKMNPKHKCVLW